MTGPGIAAGLAAATAIVLAGSRLHRRSVRALPGRTAPPTVRGASRCRRILAFAALAVCCVLALGPAVTVVVGGAVVGIVLLRRRRRTQATQQAIDGAMPDAIELMVMCLHAGLTPPQAIGELARVAPAPVRPGFEATDLRLHRGAGFADALVELSAQCGRSALPLVSALGAAVRDGLPLAPVLDRLGDEANAARRRAGETAARRLPVRLSFPLVVCTLPSFVLLAIAPAVLGALSTVRGSSP
jgi:Flp pilus assembly protein TadB